VNRHPEEVTQVIEMLSDEFARVNGGPIVFYEDDARMFLHNSSNTTLQLKYPALSVL
jgi:hypothetical protein